MSRPTDHELFQDQLDIALASKGKLCLPNIEEIHDPVLALLDIAHCSRHAETPYQLLVRKFDPPLPTGQTSEVAYYPKIFLNTGGMGGRFDGSGVILCSGYPKAKAFKFTMCHHEWDESGANHSRGWHPKVCTKCGFDASIDSGD